MRLGQNREWNAMALEEYGNPWKPTSGDSFAIVFLSFGAFQVDLIPKFIMASGDLALGRETV